MRRQTFRSYRVQKKWGRDHWSIYSLPRSLADTLNELAADKTAKGFTNRTKIECRLVPDDCDVTTALLLAENITQAPMKATDEFEAFARMI